MTGRFAHRAALASGRQAAGVGDQTDPTACPYGNADCPNEDGLPCADCLLEVSD